MQLLTNSPSEKSSVWRIVAQFSKNSSRQIEAFEASVSSFNEPCLEQSECAINFATHLYLNREWSSIGPLCQLCRLGLDTAEKNFESFAILIRSSVLEVLTADEGFELNRFTPSSSTVQCPQSFTNLCFIKLKSTCHLQSANFLHPLTQCIYVQTCFSAPFICTSDALLSQQFALICPSDRLLI